jgi:hypothetical protein
MPGDVFPKPDRLVSDQALRAYRARHPRCELRSCFREACPQPHHLRGRKMGRDDSDANLLSLCKEHHEEWHRGRRTWFARHGDALHPEARAKVARVLGEVR